MTSFQSWSGAQLHPRRGPPLKSLSPSSRRPHLARFAHARHLIGGRLDVHGADRPRRFEGWGRVIPLTLNVLRNYLQHVIGGAMSLGDCAAADADAIQYIEKYKIIKDAPAIMTDAAQRPDIRIEGRSRNIRSIGWIVPRRRLRTMSDCSTRTMAVLGLIMT